MYEGMKRTNKNLLLAYVAVSILAYPVYAGVFFLSDIWSGDRNMLRQLHETQRHLWDTFWADYAHALPVFIIISALLFLLPRLLASHHPRAQWLPLPLGLLAGGGFGVYFSSMALDWVALLHAFVGTVLGGLFSGIARGQR